MEYFSSPPVQWGRGCRVKETKKQRLPPPHSNPDVPWIWRSVVTSREDYGLSLAHKITYELTTLCIVILFLSFFQLKKGYISGVLISLFTDKIELLKNIYLFIYLFIWLHWVLLAACKIFFAACEIFVAACGIFSCGRRTLSCSMWDLVPWPGIKPGSPALGVWSLSHWTTRDVPELFKERLPANFILFCDLPLMSFIQFSTEVFVSSVILLEKGLPVFHLWYFLASRSFEFLHNKIY